MSHFDDFDDFAKMFFQTRTVNELKALLGFTDEVEETLKELAPLVEQNIERVIEKFYGFVTKNSRAAAYFTSEKQIKTLQNVNRKSFVQCFTPPIDQNYFTARLKIGWSHWRIDLASDLYFAAIGLLSRIFQDLWQDLLKDDPEKLHRALQATSITMNAESYVTIEAFFLAKSKELKEQHDNLGEILHNLEEGFFALDKSGKIGPVASHACEDLFGEKVAERPFLSMSAIPKEKRQFIKSGLDQVFDNFMPIDMTIDMLPKQITKTDGRILSLKYNPILDESGEPFKIIIIANDITEVIEKQQKAEEEAMQNRCLVGILKDLNGFMQFVEDTVSDIDVIEKSNDRVLVKRLLHTIKGNSGAFGLNNLAKITHKIEDAYEEVVAKDLRSVHKDYAKTLKTHLSEFVDDNLSMLGISLNSEREKIHSITQADLDFFKSKINGLSDSPLKNDLISITKHIERMPIASLISSYHPTIMRLADRLEKKIKFHVEGGDCRVDPIFVRGVLKNLIHAVRNACDHGIETPEERLAAHKKEYATISFSTSIEPSRGILMTLKDDGRGINETALFNKAISNGLLTETEAKAMTTSQKLMLIFSDGVSTKDTVSDLSGRGVGLAALKYDVEQAGGSVKVLSQKGQGTCLEIWIPFARKMAA